MKPSADNHRKIYAFSVLFVLCALFLVWHPAPRVESALNLSERAALPNYDIRADRSDSARRAIEKFLSEAGVTSADAAATRKGSLRAESDLLRTARVKLKIERSETTQTPEIITPDPANGIAFLTAPSNERRAPILKNYLKQNSELIGLTDARIDALETAADYTNPDGELSFVILAQKIDGVPVFGGEAAAGFTKRGEIIRVINNLAPALDEAQLSADFGSAEEAAARAVKYIDGAPEFGQTTTEKFYFPIDTGVVRPAWRVMLWTPTDAFYVVSDARDGTLLWRKNLTERQTQTATFEVYGNTTGMTRTGDSPSPFTPGCTTPIGCAQPPAVMRQTITLIGNEPPYAFNNNGWIPDGENRTIGNAVEAGIDRDGTNGIDLNGWAFGNPNRNFVYVYNPAPGIPPPGEEPLPTTQTYPPSPFQQGSITNAFYAANRWHDETYRLGFTEAARNFQIDNFGRGGQGNDSLSVEVQDSMGFNGVNFSGGADGNRGRLQLTIWNFATPDRDSALDSHVIMHELTHGLSTRLHGNATGLNNNMARSMGEGWSDFYAFAMLSEPTDNPLGTHALAGYVTYQLGGSTSNYYYGLRRFPTAIKASVGSNGLPHNPLTFKYLNANCDTFIGTTTTNPNSAFPRNPVISTSSGVQACDQIHNAGEVWSTALWEVRNQLIELHGAEQGNRRALQYITDGMKLSPLNPNMLHARDAIIAAASASDANDVLPVRRGFAIRGMGYYASIQNPGNAANNTTVVTESFDVLGNVFINPDITVSDPGGNNNGYPEAGETILIGVPLTNNTGAPITDINVRINGGSPVSYGTIINGQAVVRQISFTVPGNTPCGSFLELNINISSSSGTRTETRSIRIGVPVGGAPATFANSTPLTIPSSGASTPYGTSLNVSGLAGSKKIRLELTGFSHTFPGDVDVLLVGPGGQKFIAMSDAVNISSTQTNANVGLRDDAALLLPAGENINMNGDWKPTDHNSGDTFPAPAPAAPYSQPAPSGTSTFASVFGVAGANLNGTWTLYVVDDASSDGGSLAGWKLTFEPDDYICCSCPLRQTTVVSTPDESSVIPTCSCAPRARADFDGDGKSDLAVFRPSEGNWYLLQSSLGFGAVNWGLSGDRLVPGDYDGDGKTDFAVFRPTADSSQPDFYVLRSGNFTYGAYSWGLPGDVPVIEDYDGDQRRDLAVYRPSNHTFYALRSIDGNVMTYAGITSGVPAAGDFDGDGKGDFASYSTDGWYLASSSANFATVSYTQWGLAGDIPVPADYDADGKDDFAVFRPSDGIWYIRQSTGANAFVQFGLAGDVPVPGDYDGDGKSDVAVYRNGIWYLLRSTSGISIVQFGLGGDTPIANRYLP